MERDSVELRGALQDVERSRLDARRELQELRTQVKLLDSESSQRSEEAAALQSRVTSDEEREEERRRHSLGLAQRVAQSEQARETLRRESDHSLGLAQRVAQSEQARETLRRELASLQHRVRDQEGEWRACERRLLSALEECRESERRSADSCRALEERLAAAATDGAQLRLALSASEGRERGHEGQLARSESERRDAELRLANLHSALRRTLGIGLSGRRAADRERAASPSAD
ncbi:uncharacterized protein LOC144954033, partial [Lampetra fluviatilis]